MTPSGKKIKTEEFIQVEDDAEQILATFHIYKPPVPTGIIKKIFNQCTIDIIAFSDEAMGFSYPDEEKGIWRILINDKLSLEAKRFTAFHEFYHLLQGKPGYHKGTEEGAAEEIKANYFAACLLMPARWVRKYWEEYEDVSMLALIFDVSEFAVRIRLKNLENYLAA